MLAEAEVLATVTNLTKRLVGGREVKSTQFVLLLAAFYTLLFLYVV